MRNFKRIFQFAFILIILGFTIYYFYPINKIPDGIDIDKIVVFKSRHELLAYSNGKIIVSYKIALGKNPTGNKHFAGDNRTPEGLYIINNKNPNSDFFKNLGISYPRQEDIDEAARFMKLAGGDIKIHGLKNGHGYLGKFHRWKDWTNGCIALTNKEMEELYNHVKIGTPIEIYK
jgi:murein L,D-transpeptidase YafK